MERQCLVCNAPNTLTLPPNDSEVEDTAPDDIELTADTPEPPEPPDDAGAPSPDAPKLGSEAAPDDTMLSDDALKPPIGSVSPVRPW